MKHLTRDFLTLASASCPGTNMYALSIFLLGCGGFRSTGQTNFDMSLGAALVARGVSASINLVAGHNDVYLPSSSYVVSSADVGRILVLKSQLFPTSNSGLFRVSAVNSGTNTLTVDYRSTAFPPSEQYLPWQLYVDEVTASLGWQSGSNGTLGYGSFNYSSLATASASRIVLLSPDQSSWQVRMCLESLQDVNGAAPSGFSIAPGFGGDSAGDFFPIHHDEGSGHDQHLYLHTALYNNTTSSTYRGMVVGLTPFLSASPGVLWSKGQWRISMIVDDVSGSCGIVNRNVSLAAPATSGSGWAAFGLCLDEQQFDQTAQSDPSRNCPRLFVAGSSNGASNLTWKSQFHVDNNMQVVGFAKRGYPIPGVLSCYSDISNPVGHVRYLTSSVDTPWTNSVELLDVEVLVGTVDQTVSASTPQVFFPLQPRRLGRLPFFMQGRANYTSWTITNVGTGSNADYYHTKDGVFLEWGGPVPTDNVTSSLPRPVITSGSVEDQQGLMQFGASLPGSDPIVSPAIPLVSHVDGTRFRKTYSYYRQVPVNVGYVKGGSTPTRS